MIGNVVDIRLFRRMWSTFKVLHHNPISAVHKNATSCVKLYKSKSKLIIGGGVRNGD